MTYSVIASAAKQSMDPLEKILQLLVKALRAPLERKETVDEFHSCFFDNEQVLERSIGEGAYQVLADLSWDLNFFVANPVWRMQDPSYYGDERLGEEIKEALRRLSQLGIAVPDGL